MSLSEHLLPISDYLVNRSLAADVEGPPISMRDTRGELSMRIVSTDTGTPNGVLTLQGSVTGANWTDIPGAAPQLPDSGNLAAGTRICVWYGLNFEYVRLKWTRSSGGTGATISASARVR